MPPPHETDDCLQTILRDLATPDREVYSRGGEAFQAANPQLQSAVVAALLKALRGQDSDGRVDAAWGLGVIRHAPAVPVLLKALRDPDSEVRYTAVEALGNIGDPAAAPALVELALCEDTPLSLPARSALFRIKEKDPSLAATLVAATLADLPLCVRINAAEALQSFDDSLAVPPLATALHHPNPYIRIAAVTALGHFGRAAALPPLVAALADPHPDIALGAALELGFIQDRAAVDGLLDALRDPRSEVRWGSASALAHIGEVAAVPGLIAAFDHEEDAEVRRIICKAVANITQAAKARAGDALQKAMPFLRQVRDSHSSIIVRMQANRGLEDLRDEETADRTPLVDAPHADWPALTDGELCDNYKALRVTYLVHRISLRQPEQPFSSKYMAGELRAKHGIRCSDQNVLDCLRDAQELFRNYFKNPDFPLYESRQRVGVQFWPVDASREHTRAWEILDGLFPDLSTKPAGRAGSARMVDKR